MKFLTSYKGKEWTQSLHHFIPAGLGAQQDNGAIVYIMMSRCTCDKISLFVELHVHKFWDF